MNKNHPDNLTPVQCLQNRLNIIDRYIARLTKSGDTGSDFKKFYENKSNQFKAAIETLKQ